MKIKDTQINHLNTFIGLSPTNIRLDWKVEECLRQSAFQVRAIQNGVVVEDSGKIVSSLTSYRFKNELAYQSEIRIELTCFDEKEIEATSSILLVTGKDFSQLHAKWINPEIQLPKKDEPQLGAYLKKNFQLSTFKLDSKAYFYATCHGIMNIYINGQEITPNLLLPGSQEYDKRLMMETIPVSTFLKEGENEIIVILGNGWYRGSIGNDHHKNNYGKDIAFLGELDIDGACFLKSDESWLAMDDSPLGKNDLMVGEEFDARKLDNAKFHAVKLESFGFDNLIHRDCEPVLKQEKFQAKKIKTPNGESIFDFGVNLAGFVEFEVNAKEGDKIEIEYGEVLDKDGNFTVNNFQGKAQNPQKEVYICKEGKNHYRPLATYYGFRYVRVKGDCKLELEELSAYSIYSNLKQTSTFECGNHDVNQLFQNAIRSMKGNFIDVPTDCPTREKSGFSGDAQGFVDTANLLMDAASSYNKWMAENRAGQFKDGCLPQISPKINSPKKKNKMMGIMSLDGGVGWSDALEIIAYRLYQLYQDQSMLIDNYDAIKRWVDFEIKKAKKTRSSNRKILPKEHRRYMIDKGWMWGEWLEPGQDSVTYMKNLIFHGDPEVGTAYLYLNCDYLSKIATILGKEEDAKHYSSLKEKVKEAYRAVYTKNGVVNEQKRQCRFVRPIAFDLLSEEEKKENASLLAKLIQENGNHLNTGFLTTHYLNRVLTDYGQEKSAFDLLLQESYPSWLYAVKKGCTSIPEDWNCFKEDGNPIDSFNHYSYGAIAGWLIDSVLGIRVEEGKIEIIPHVDKRLGFAKGYYDSPYGKIVSNWAIKDGKTYYEFEIPSNAKATIVLKEEKIEVGPGKISFVR